jgi:putative endonuclease
MLDHTEYLEKRNDEHNKGKGDQFSGSCLPWDFMYHEEFATRSEAIKREKEIKLKKSRKYIEWLIARRG